MTSSQQPVDANVRERALDPQTSFLIQAPAGSGKTELLIQRYLRLLSIIDEPEEILAITFTRKASAEMRNRIEDALHRATHGLEPGPDKPHLQIGYQLAREVVTRDQARGWGLAEYPARLRIGTIDAINTRLSRSAPLSAGLTSGNALRDDSTALYREAARRVMAMGDEENAIGLAIRALLLHLENRTEQLENLLQEMLGSRDQWMRHLGSGHIEDETEFRIWLEDKLEELVNNLMAEAADALPEKLSTSMLQVLTDAAEGSDKDSPLASWAYQSQLPPLTVANLDLWQSAAALFLTQAGSWRKTVNVKNGFPPERKEQKQNALEFLITLKDYPAFEAALSRVQGLPKPSYSDDQWQVLLALIKILPTTVASLKQLFAERGETDYTEIAHEALGALGVDDDVSELTLALDYQIKHILLDEFQDTSRSQYELVKKLTSGWQSEPEKTAFLVGDPMQSIYRFREAEVGLFLETQEKGLGDLELEFLQLETNFRSDGQVINWFNEVFAQVMPAHADAASGAVPFVPSQSWHDGKASSGVYWHVVAKGDKAEEAQLICDLVLEALEESTEQTIGILVRSRAHAGETAQALRAAGIGFVATDLENLDDQSFIQDLLALTRAISHPSDRIAWLACLRAPWCGLTLNDLHELAAKDHKSSIWSLINQQDAVSRLSSDGQQRLQVFRHVLQRALARRGSGKLRDLVFGAWLQLGGSALLPMPGDIELVEKYLGIVESLEQGGDCIDGAELLKKVSSESVTRSERQGVVEIMTIHKAKGLEFDTVILPGLGYKTRVSGQPLLLFYELAQAVDDPALIVAPIKPSKDKKADNLYQLLWDFERDQDLYEQSRLLYVAATRSRKKLHLFATLKLDAEGEVSAPENSTLLARLWPAVRDQLEPLAKKRLVPSEQEPDAVVDAAQWFSVPAERLAYLPEPGFKDSDELLEQAAEVEFEWASQWAKHVGSVVHRWLQDMSEQGITDASSEWVDSQRAAFRRLLRQLGVERQMLAQAEDRVAKALKNTLNDETGKWILSAEHVEHAAELPVTFAGPTGYERLIIDRTFVCQEGIRWIIDYKLSIHEGSDIESFLRSEEERYRPQLNRYREAMRHMDSREVRTALYFPLMQKLHIVDY
ncbi:MAG: UvrD-helicase domain-containing protein [Gammaproteobacteria bacterium]|nr:UvrD-helicase domain-containing protein [Gammaproteobacteria bacterium]